MANQKSISTDLRGDSPPRFTISLLMQTTAGIAVLLGVLKTLDFEVSEFWSDNWLVSGLRAIFLAIPIACTGFALGLLAIPVRNVFGARIAFPVYGGHWLLIYHALLVVLFALAWFLHRQEPIDAMAHAERSFFILLFGMIYAVGGCVWLTAFLRSVDDSGTWRKYYGLRATFHFLGFLCSALVAFQWMFGDEAGFRYEYIQVLIFAKVLEWGLAGLYFIGTIYLDWIISAERDWLHGVGLAHSIVMPGYFIFFAA